MKKAIVTIDSDDIFHIMTQTSENAFSALNVTVDRTDEFYIANLCLKLYDALNGQPFQISEFGTMLMRITSPASQEVSLTDIEMICEGIRRFCSGNLIWGLETDDSAETINVDLIFQINNPKII